MKSIYDIRLENMRMLMAEFETQQAFADFLDRTPTLVSRYAGPHPTKRIGEAMARHIEICFGKEKYWIDANHTASIAESPASYTAAPTSESSQNLALQIEQMDMRKKNLAQRIVEAIDEGKLSDEDLRLLKILIARLSHQSSS